MADDFGMGYALGQDSGGRNSEGFFGSEGIWAVIILAIIFGWGRNGFGGSGGGDQGALTRADLCSGFNFNNLDGAVRGVQQGICDGFYAMNTSLLSGFHGVDNAVCALRTRRRYSTVVSTSATGGTFRLLGKASCCPDYSLTGINGTAPAAGGETA